MSFAHDYRRRCALCRRLLPQGCSVCPDGCRGTEEYQAPAADGPERVFSTTLPAPPATKPAPTPTPTPLAAGQKTVTPLVSSPPTLNGPEPLKPWRPRFRCGCPAPFELPAFAAAQMVCRMHSRSDDALAPGGETATAVVAMVRRTFVEKKAPVRPAEHLEKPVARRKKVPEAVQDLDADWMPDGGLTDEEEGRKAALLARKAQEAEQAMEQRSATVKAATARKTARERAKRAGVECEEAQP